VLRFAWSSPAFASPHGPFLERLYAIRVQFARDDAMWEEVVTKKESFSHTGALEPV
jgi:hypothetical protein